MSTIPDSWAWHLVTIPLPERIPELTAGDLVFIRISSITLIRHPNLNGLMKLQWTVDYRLDNSGDIQPLAVVNNYGLVETVFTANVSHSRLNDNDIAYWINQCVRYTTLHTLMGRFSDASGFSLDVRLKNKHASREVIMVSAPSVSTTVYRFREIIHHVCFGLVNQELVQTESKLICSGEIDDVVVTNLPFVWGDSLLLTAMQTLFGGNVNINRYQSKRDL